MNHWEKIFMKRLVPTEPFICKESQKIIASVLIPIGFKQETARYEILLTKRSEQVETHKGQISFPGGLFEPSDGNLLKTALRETEEEVGLLEKEIQILGNLEPVYTLKDVVIYPWVAKVQFPQELKISEREVERAIFLPLDQLLSEGLKPVEVSVNEKGIPFTVSSIGIICENELIWGASAKILEQLYTLLK
ncbi:MAG: CoA pyrophosphatase [Deltaproteobacteria bacterium]|nr:CoA pyrophosphatase [Deltaproteobacteria bacterium]